MFLRIPLFLYIFQLLRQPFLTFVFVLFVCATIHQNTLIGLKNNHFMTLELDKSNWYFSPLIDRF